MFAHLILTQQVQRYNRLRAFTLRLERRCRFLVQVLMRPITPVWPVVRAAGRRDEASLRSSPWVRRGCDNGREDEGDECELHRVRMSRA